MLNRINYPEKDVAVDRLLTVTSEGEFSPGDRLSQEQDLIEMLGIDHSALRHALSHLETERLIWRFIGKGIFVSHGGVGPVDVPSAGRHQMTPIEMMRARLRIERAITREAALNASGEATARITSAMEKARDDFFTGL